jgi:hypothetical protein
LTALAFVDPKFNQWIVPFGLDAQFWVGLLGVTTWHLAKNLGVDVAT